MKLAEALIERANLNKIAQDLLGRVNANLVVEEGETPDEDPAGLMSELASVQTRFGELVKAINRTNTMTTITWSPLGEISIADAVVHRDFLDERVKTLRTILGNLSVNRTDRYERRMFGEEAERVRYERLVVPADVRSQMDALSRARRELDTLIQGANWATDLIN
jgi:hypothetical protein